ncbi:hypothetical protein HJG43_09040 [Kineosporiaceae bacterium SCSIO 59966]|nr:hypothetical protein HJG43_09040 [Kineosporiaceae bacterium SCSIO 59966]
MRQPRRLLEQRTSSSGPDGGAPRLWGRITRWLQKVGHDAVDAASARRTAMMAAAADQRGTRKRSIPTIAVGLAGLGTMFGAVSQNALAVNFTTSADTFAVYSNYLQGTSVAAYLAENGTEDGTTGVAEFGIGQAAFAGLCAIATQDLPAGTAMSLVITAGEPVHDSFSGTSVPDGVTLDEDGALAGDSLEGAIQASNLFLNSDALGGYGNQIGGLNLGQSAESVYGSARVDWPTGQTQPTPGAFGLSAERLNLAGLHAATYGVSFGGEITLPRLKLQVFLGEKTQADCPGAAS